MREFLEMVEVMHRLRTECPWDKEQSLKSLRTYLLEEAYECVEAIDDYDANHKKDPALLIEELGDVLLQVLFQSEILTEDLKRPVIQEVIVKLKEKLIRRHPHIWPPENAPASHAKTSQAVYAQWEEIKKAEKGGKPRESQLDGLSKGLTALQKAMKLGERSKKAKFDWNTMDEVVRDFESEVKEWHEAKTDEEKESELGDILFCIAQMARHQKTDPEVALDGANRRFEARFRKMEEFCKKENRAWENLTLNEKEELWKRAKKAL